MVGNPGSKRLPSAEFWHNTGSEGLISAGRPAGASPIAPWTRSVL